MSLKRIEADWPELHKVWEPGSPNPESSPCVRITCEDYELARASIHALRGLPDDALAGGWNYAGQNAYALKLEQQCAEHKRQNDAFEAELQAVTVQREELRALIARCNSFLAGTGAEDFTRWELESALAKHGGQ